MKSNVIVCWPESQMLMDKEGFIKNCSLINSARGIDVYGSSAYIVNAEWYQKFTNGELKDSTEEYDEDEFDICCDDDIIFSCEEE